MILQVDKGRCNGSDTRKGNMEFCFLRVLLFVALTARILGDGECFTNEVRENGVSMFANYLDLLTLVYLNV